MGVVSNELDQSFLELKIGKNNTFKNTSSIVCTDECFITLL